MTKYRDFTHNEVITSDGTIYTDSFDLDYDVIEQLDVDLKVNNYISGNVTVTPQISVDKKNWEDLSSDAFSTISSNASESRVVPTPNPYIRFKIVASGGASMSVGIFARPGSGDQGTSSTTRVVEQYAPGYEDNQANRALTEDRNTPANINTAGTTTIMNGSGFVKSVRVIGGTLGDVTIYDNIAASGTILLPTVTPVSNGVLLENITVNNGLTIVTAANTVLTIAYRLD